MRLDRGVPSVEQWVKNLTAAARVAVEVQVRSPAQPNGLKYLALPETQRNDPIQSLTQELPNAMGAPKKKKKLKMKKKKKRQGFKETSSQVIHTACKYLGLSVT